MSDISDKEWHRLRKEVSRAYAKLVGESFVRLPLTYRLLILDDGDNRKFFKWLTTTVWFKEERGSRSHVELTVSSIEAQVPIGKLASKKAKGRKAEGVECLKDMLQDARLFSNRTYGLGFFYMEDVKLFLEFVGTLNDVTLWIEDIEIRSGARWKKYIRRKGKLDKEAN